MWRISSPNDDLMQYYSLQNALGPGGIRCRRLAGGPIALPSVSKGLAVGDVLGVAL